MASLCLAQIDENSSFIQTSSNDPLVLPTPLTHGVPQMDLSDEKTPEVWPHMFSYGDCTPEAWPKTPTPRGLWPKTPSRCGFSLGDQTPEYWPEFAPSFRMDIQQPNSLQAPPLTVIPCPSINTPQTFVPMWPSQLASPLGMVFDGNSSSVSGARVSLNSANSLSNKAQCEDGFNVCSSNVSAAKAIPSKAPAMKVPPKKKFWQGTEDACPVAVYVDLSALKERRTAVARTDITQ